MDRFRGAALIACMAAALGCGRSQPAPSCDELRREVSRAWRQDLHGLTDLTLRTTERLIEKSARTPLDDAVSATLRVTSRLLDARDALGDRRLEDVGRLANQARDEAAKAAGSLRRGSLKPDTEPIIQAMEEATTAAARVAERGGARTAEALAQALQAASRADEALAAAWEQANEERQRAVAAIDQEAARIRAAAALASEAAASSHDTQRVLESSRRVPSTPDRPTYTAAMKAAAALERTCR